MNREPSLSRWKRRCRIPASGLGLVAAIAALALPFLAALAVEEDPNQVRVFVTRDLRGYLEPCDCRAGILGGFPRRATLVERARPDLLLDAGDLVFQASPYDLLKLRLMLELKGELGYAAVSIGRREAEFSKEELLRVAKDSPVPLVSANLADRDGKLVLPGHLVVEKCGHRFGIVGLVTRDSNPGDGLTVLDPLSALRRVLKDLSARCDFVILLAGLTVREMERVLPEVEGVDLVLGGYIPKGSEHLEKLAEIPCFFVQGKGQYLGEVVLRREADSLRPVSGRRIVLGPEITSGKAIERRIHDFKLSLKSLDLLRRQPGKSPYVGSASCAACHGKIHASWKESTHARAVDSLTPEKGRYDPQCLRCHATAPGRGGYVSEEKTPEFTGVGCESCHGPSKSHANAALAEARPRPPGRPRSTCLTCHEADHSRPFHEPERLRAIRHWSEENDR